MNYEHDLPYSLTMSEKMRGSQKFHPSERKNALKALVTGATGFIGSHLTEALIRKGVQVRCLVRTTSDLRWLQGLPVEFVHGDCTDKSSLKEAVRDVDWVFHVAGTIKALKEETYFEVNGVGTENLIRACLDTNPGLQKFMYISSQAAAGPSRNGRAAQETDPCVPVSAYGLSKRRGEESVLAHAHELPVIILRPCVVYGPRDTGLFVLFKCLSRKIKPCFTGRPQRLSLCYVQDIVRGIVLAAESPAKSGEVFFLSDGSTYRMEEIGDILAHALGVQAVRVRFPRQLITGLACCAGFLSKLLGRPLPLNPDKAKEIVQDEWVCDITHAKTVLGFAPMVPLSQGAALTAAWYKQEKWL